MQRPAMTQAEIDEAPTALVRVHCHQHGVCLYAGDTEPAGGAAAVAAAAGCPPWAPLEPGQREHDRALFDACPVAQAAEEDRAAGNHHPHGG